MESRFLVAASQLLGMLPFVSGMIRFFGNLQTRWCSCMAPGLFLLDKNKTYCSSYLLVRLDDSTKENGCLAIHCRQS
jgi:hypothetical protein